MKHGVYIYKWEIENKGVRHLRCVADEDLAVFPVDVHCLSKLRPCVDLARKIDKDEHRSLFFIVVSWNSTEGFVLSLLSVNFTSETVCATFKLVDC